MHREELEQTLVLIKPDALKNSLTGYVLSLLSELHTGLRFAGAKIVRVSPMLAEEHYAEHKGKVFFPSLLEYIMGDVHYPEEAWKRRVIALVYQGKDAIKKIRDICGPTNPHNAREQKPGSIRSLGTIVPIKDASGVVVSDRMDNLIHASSSVSDAEREIKLWFRPNDIPPAMRPYPAETSDGHYYLKKDKILPSYEPGGFCLVAPGDAVWATDLAALKLLVKGQNAPISVGAIAAKYMINEERE